MSKYRYRYPNQLPQKPPETWQDPPLPQDARYLDMDEIARLNAMAEDETATEDDEAAEPKHARLKAVIVAFIVVVCFTLWSVADIMQYAGLPDLGFLRSSARLSDDETVADLKAAVVTISGAYGSGTGFNIDPGGVIITNKHVVEGERSLNISFSDGSVFASKDWQQLDEADLAIVKINGADLPCVELAADYLVEQDKLIFVGNPLGFDWTVSEGVALGYFTLGDSQTPILFFSGPVYPGSSGSPIFNSQGQVAAVIFATLADEEQKGLAVPAQVLRQHLEQEQ